MKKLICILSAVFLSLTFSGANAHAKNYNMVFVPASEKGDENDYTSLIKIVNKLTGFKRTKPLPDIPSDYNVPINPKGQSRYKYRKGGSVDLSNFKGIFAVSLGSFCLKDPPAAFLGLAKSSLIFLKSLLLI